MPRPDYEKFVDLAQNELPKNMQVLSWRVHKGYHHVFNKVMLIDDAVVNRVKKDSGLNIDEGIYIDMFPLDGAPRNVMCRQLYWLKRWLFRSLGVYLSEKMMSFCHLPLHLCGWFVHLVYPSVKTSEDAMRLMDKWFQTYEFKELEYSLYAAEDYVFYKPGSFSVPVTGAFGSWGYVPLPTLYDSVLRAQYGDYMQLPPLEMRVPKHQLMR